MPPAGPDAGQTDGLTPPVRLLRFHDLRAGGASGFPAGAVVLDARDGETAPYPAIPGGAGDGETRRLSVWLPSSDEGDFPERLARAVALGAGTIVLAATAGSRDIERLAARLAVIEAETGLADGALRIVASIDGPAGIFGLGTLRPHPRLAALLCDTAHLTAALACRPDAPAILQARGLTVLAASGCGVPALLATQDPEAAASAGGEGFAALLVPAA